MWRNVVSTAPTWEPLTLSEIKDVRRVTGSDADADLDRLGTAVREMMEANLSLAIPAQTRVLTLDRWPSSSPRHWFQGYGGQRIHLPYGPVRAVSSITYLESVAGVSTTLATNQYVVYGAATTPAKDDHKSVAYITPAYGISWPSLYPMPEAITITYTCGWLTRGAIPEAIRHAMLVELGNLDEHRESRIVGTITASMDTVENLIATHRCYHEFGTDCG